MRKTEKALRFIARPLGRRDFPNGLERVMVPQFGRESMLFLEREGNEGGSSSWSEMSGRGRGGGSERWRGRGRGEAKGKGKMEVDVRKFFLYFTS
ncbi:MAG: hypothetical protein ACYS47_07835 [Planctomycetota bacterium]